MPLSNITQPPGADTIKLDGTQRHGSRISLVTGAGQGIGCAIALRLASDGFDVAINDIDSNEEAVLQVMKEIQDVTRQRCRGVYADVSKEEDVVRMVDTVVAALGGLDVLVANAGIAVVERVVDLTVDTWDRVFAVNARSVMLCYKYAARVMTKQGRSGRISGACSTAGKRGAQSASAYCASKSAVRGLSQSAAIELAPYGINVNCYAPGAIHTALLENLAEALAGGSDKKMEYIKKRVDATPLGRIGTPDDVAGVVSYLAVKDSRFVTGQSIIVDGGTYFD